MPDTIVLPKLTRTEVFKSNMTFLSQEKLGSSDFKFDITLQHHVDPAIKDQVVVIVAVDILHPMNRKKTVGEFTMGYYFDMSAYNGHLGLDEDGDLFVKDDIAKVINDIAYSTTRGALFMETKGTAFHQALLPIVAVDDLAGDC